VQQSLLLAPEHPGMRPSGIDPLDRGSCSAASTEGRHRVRV
jgi:hypothetical protein